MPRGPKRSALEVNKEKLASVEEKLAKSLGRTKAKPGAREKGN